MRPAILIHGPTASGKTALAIALAKGVDGEIINADAMQVYADLRVLTARPDDNELVQAPHHMFGHIDGAVRYSTGQWVSDAAAVIADIRARDKTPILVGGTGLYLSSLTKGLSAIPDVPDDIRTEALHLVQDDARAAHARLAEVDPEAAIRINVADGQRVSRALGVYMATGRPISHFQTPAPPLLGRGEWLGVALTPKRQTLYARIDARFDRMMDNGAYEEMLGLHGRGLPRDLPVMRAHGMPGFCDYLEGGCTLEAAIERAKRDTRRYAKRQFTWIAHQLTTWPRIPSEAVKTRSEVVHSLLGALTAGF